MLPNIGVVCNFLGQDGGHKMGSSVFAQTTSFFTKIKLHTGTEDFHVLQYFKNSLVFLALSSHGPSSLSSRWFPSGS
jgi:hypothetical protein